MRKINLFSYLAVFSGLLIQSLASNSIYAKTQPNVVIIYGDDVGFGDVGVYGSKLILTPEIDKLAASGIRFTDGHSSAATCTPSRFSLLTGISAFRYGARVLPPNAPLIVPTDKLTLAKLFKKAGYQTAVIGKWHLGIGKEGETVDWNGDAKPGPLELGFDYSFLLPSTNDRVPSVYLEGHKVVNLDNKDPLYVGDTLAEVQISGSTQYPDGKTNREAMTYYQSSHGHNNSVINGIGRIGYMSGGKSALWSDEEMSDVFLDKTRSYIEENKDKPFFLYFASQDIHVPRTPHPRFQGATKLGYRGDAMVQFDWTVKEILAALDKHGLTENTIIVFSSDNGPVYDDGYIDGTTVKRSNKEGDRGHDASGIWRGGKYQIFEGGTRVPFIVSWPGTIKPGISDTMVNQIDLLASFADLLDVDLAKNEAIDSRNTLAAFMNEKSAELPFMLEETRLLALRMGDWKFVPAVKGYKVVKGKKIDQTAELYNLATDPSEQTNIVDKHPEKVKEMVAILDKLQSQGAREVSVNDKKL